LSAGLSCPIAFLLCNLGRAKNSRQKLAFLSKFFRGQTADKTLYSSVFSVPLWQNFSALLVLELVEGISEIFSLRLGCEISV